MPEVLNIEEPHFLLKVWQISEDISFFEKKIEMNQSEKKQLDLIKRTSKKLQWLATRYLLKSLTNNKEIKKNKHGKPFFKNKKNGFFSISHCQKYAAIIYSKTHNVGIDIEPEREKVLRIAPKFLSKSELLFIKPNDIKQHISCWSIKEAAFKWYGKEYIPFKDNIQISPFTYNDNNISAVNVKIISAKKTDKLKAYYLSIDNHCLAFCINIKKRTETLKE